MMQAKFMAIRHEFMVDSWQIATITGRVYVRVHGKYGELMANRHEHKADSWQLAINTTWLP